MSVMQSAPGPHTVIDGQRYLYFAGTGYLGLQGHPDIAWAACEAVERYGVGTATSRAGHGDSPPVLEVEKLAAEFFDTEDAVYLPSGYMSVKALPLGHELGAAQILVAEASHYAVHEAARARTDCAQAFDHRREGDLEEKLAAADAARRIIFSDGVFSALGDIAPIDRYFTALKPYGDGAMVVIDDAHGVGVLGNHGRGTFEHFNYVVSHESDGSDSLPTWRLGATCSKALGGYGGVVPGARRTVQHIRESAAEFRGASAPPSPVAGATAKALQIVMQQPELRQRLHANVTTVKSGLREMGLDVNDTPVPIVCLELKTADYMKGIVEQLKTRGIFIGYLPRYSGLGKQGALRIAVFANHTDAMIAQLLDATREVL